MKKTTVIINSALSILLAAGLFTGYSILHPRKEDVKETYEAATLRDVVKTVSASGKVEPLSELGLNFTSSGQLTELNVSVGEYVSKGRVLAKIDDQSANSNVLQASATLVQANQNLVSARNTLANTSNPKSSIDLAYQDKQLNSQKLALTQAKANLEQFKATMSDSAKSYQNSVDSAQLKYDQAKITYNNYLGTYQGNGYSYSYCSTLNSVNGTCENLLSYYFSLANASRSLEDAKLTQQQNLLKDNNSLQSYQNSVDTAQANLDSFNAQISQSNQPSTEGSIKVANAQVEQAEENVKSAKASLEYAKSQLEKTKLISPINGFIVAIASSIGQTPGTTSIGSNNTSGFIIIATTNELQVRAQFAEADISNIRSGQMAELTFDAVSGLTVAGTVKSVAQINNSTSSGSVVTYDVVVKVSKQDKSIKAGMTSKATIKTNVKSNVLSLPSSVLTSTPAGYFVKLKPLSKDSDPKQQKVEVGLKGDTYVEILSGLKEGDLVIKPASGANSVFPAGGIPGGLPGGLGGGLGGSLG